MAQILQFPKRTRYRPVRISRTERHEIWLRVTDRLLADAIRWQTQYAIQRGCGFRGLKGWTNRRARRGAWFRCAVRTELLARFLLDLEVIVKANTIELEVDDRRVRLAA